eukprot:CAMPEP_0117555838 /NCGR_PEP_ID=MMETSP0784-20121206/51486_1 /TAXON_ID=39447 /ORGANISM="" /LENGTH=301 /DNA_ID=CAMNT_0005353067 /DNA_START=9 /DNA_END=911 /DNA_ORIENTATION=-
MATPPEKKRRGEDAVYEDTNGVPREAGRLTHIGLADGELANLVVVVGHHSRAERLSKYLEPEETGGKLFHLASSRGFVTYTGMFEGKRMSVVSCGMGLPMMDFFVREARAVTKGPMAMVRFGTCGGLREVVPAGTVAVSGKGSIVVLRNHSYFEDAGEAEGSTAYSISKLCPADAELSMAVHSELSKTLGKEKAVWGANATADSFYGSQGRRDPAFNDHNEGLIDDVLEKCPEVISMEMETFQLFHMARCARPLGSIRAASAAIVVANRSSADVCSNEVLANLESEGGAALLRALASVPLG